MKNAKQQQNNFSATEKIKYFQRKIEEIENTLTHISENPRQYRPTYVCELIANRTYYEMRINFLDSKDSGAFFKWLRENKFRI